MIETCITKDGHIDMQRAWSHGRQKTGSVHVVCAHCVAELRVCACSVLVHAYWCMLERMTRDLLHHSNGSIGCSVKKSKWRRDTGLLGIYEKRS